jgi:hypothetical protein
MVFFGILAFLEQRAKGYREAFAFSAPEIPKEPMGPLIIGVCV